MANEKVIINQVTKEEIDGKFRYLFPVATIFADNTNDEVEIKYKERYDIQKVFNFTDEINQKFGASTPEEYCDYLAINSYYFLPLGSGGGTGSDVNIVGSNPQLNLESTQQDVLSKLDEILTALLINLALVGWLYNYSESVTLKANKQLIIKEELILQEGVEFIIESGAKLFIEI